MKETLNIEVTLLTAGRFSMYNSYLPGNKHAPRLERKIEELYQQIAEEEIPMSRNWIHIELGGTVIGEDETDF